MPQQRKIKNLEEMRRFAKLLVANGIKTTVKIHETGGTVPLAEYPELVARVHRLNRERPWHVRMTDDELPRRNFPGRRNRAPFAVVIDGGRGTKIIEEHPARTIYDAERIFVQMIVKYRGRKKGRVLPDADYQLPLPGGRARSNPTSKTPKTIYSIAATVIPKQELREVPKEDRGTADGIALSIERSGGPSARGTRTKILRAISEQMLSMSEDRGLRWVGTLDPRISAWSSLVAAKEALRFTDDKRTQRAVEVTERWLTGDATSQEVRNATTKAHDATSDAKTRAAYFASNSAVNAAGAIAKKSAYIVYFAARAAVTAASRDYESERYDEFDEMTEERRAEREEFEAREMNRIFLLIADALPGLPPDPKVYQ